MRFVLLAATLAVLLVLGATASDVANGEVTLTMTPYKVRAFRDGGEVSFTSTLEVGAPGVYRVDVRGLYFGESDSATDMGTVRVAFDDAAAVTLHQVSNRPATDKDAVARAEAELAAAEHEKHLCDAEVAAQEHYIESVHSVSASALAFRAPNTTIDTLLQNVDAVRQRLLQSSREVLNLRRGCDARLKAVEERLRNVSALRSAQLVHLVVGVARAGAFTVNATRAVSSLQWTPSYDVAAQLTATSQAAGQQRPTTKGTTRDVPVNLSYSAIVVHHTGQDWTDVEVELSTGQQYANEAVPTLQPVKLGVSGPIPSRRRQAYQDSNAMGIHHPDSSVFNNWQQNQNAPQQEKQSTFESFGNLYSRRFTEAPSAADGAGSATPDAAPSSVDVPSAPVSLIALPHRHRLQSGVEHRLHVATLQLSGAEERVAVPKLSQQVYLRLRVNNTSPLTLCPGPVRATIDGAAMGSMELPLITPLSTGRLNLGVDRTLTVKRTANVARRTNADGFFSADGSQAQEIQVRLRVTSTRGDAVSVRLFEAVPLSTHDTIAVNILKPAVQKGGNARFAPGLAPMRFADTDVSLDAATGAMKWIKTVPALGAIEMELAYEVVVEKDSPFTGQIPPLE